MFGKVSIGTSGITCSHLQYRCRSCGQTRLAKSVRFIGVSHGRRYKEESAEMILVQAHCDLTIRRFVVPSLSTNW
jgi:hypothetical protein